MKSSHVRLAFALATTIAIAASLTAAYAQRDWSKVEIKTIAVAPRIYMLQGAGGDIGLFVGDDGAFLIDDQYAPVSDKIKAAVAAVTPKPIRFVLNTHWHGDHVGGNEAFAGGGAVIVAHDNVRTRMLVGQLNELMKRTVDPAVPAALPVITFTDTVTFHLDGEELFAFHVPPAHTDGDAAVVFRHADVIHTGDLLFNGTYPVLDVPSGGRLSGMIAADDQLLAIAGPSTKIIPGHGNLATPADLRAFRDMLATVRERVTPLVKAGKSADEVIAAAPLADLDGKWGQGFMKAPDFLRAVHMSLMRELGIVAPVAAGSAAVPAASAAAAPTATPSPTTSPTPHP